MSIGSQAETPEVRTPCPNCGLSVVDHPENECVLGVFIAVLADRGVPKAALHDLHARCDVDALWESIGPILDDLQDGRFNR